MPATLAEASCVKSSVRRPPKRSASTPAHGPSSSGLVNWAKVTRPTVSTECASWYASSTWALFCSQVPKSEVTLPKKYQEKPGLPRSTCHGVRRSWSTRFMPNFL